MRQENVPVCQREPDSRRKLAQPILVAICRMCQRVVVAYLCVIVITWIGIATGTIREPIANTVIIVALHANNLVFPEQRENTVGMRPKTAHITQAINGLHMMAACILNHSLQS